MSDLQQTVSSLFVSLSLSNTHRHTHTSVKHATGRQSEGGDLLCGLCVFLPVCVCLGLSCYWAACDQSHFCVVNQRRFCLLKKESKGPNTFTVPLLLPFIFWYSSFLVKRKQQQQIFLFLQVRKRFGSLLLLCKYLGGFMGLKTIGKHFTHVLAYS